MRDNRLHKQPVPTEQQTNQAKVTIQPISKMANPKTRKVRLVITSLYLDPAVLIRNSILSSSHLHRAAIQTVAATTTAKLLKQYYRL